MGNLAIRSAVGSYLSSNTNQFFSKGNYWCGMLDDGFFKLGHHSSSLGQQIARLTGNKEAEDKCRSVVSGFDNARAAISTVRFIFPIHKLLTGQMFWQTDADGWRRVQHNEDGQAIIIPKEDLHTKWKKQDKVWHNESTRQISADGKYIDNNQGEYLTRDWMDIAMDICILAARLISPFRWFHNLQAIDLGRQAKWMGGVVMAAWGVVVAIGCVQSIRDLISERDTALIQKRTWEAFQAVIDVAALPFDFGVGSSHPILACVGAGLNIVSAASLITKDMIYYS